MYEITTDAPPLQKGSGRPNSALTKTLRKMKVADCIFVPDSDYTGKSSSGAMAIAIAAHNWAKRNGTIVSTTRVNGGTYIRRDA